MEEQQQEVIKMNQPSAKYRDFVLMALFAAIILLLGFTPLGFIPLVVIKATIVHIPVILGAVLLGPKKGAILGGIFGLTSLISNTMTPVVLSFAFTPVIPVPGTAQGNWLSLIVCFIPRILVGVIPYYVYRLMEKVLHKKEKGNVVSLAVAGFVGSMVNTILVMGLIYALFRDAYAQANGIPVDAVTGAVLTVVGTNGVLEALVAAVLVAAIGKVLVIFNQKHRA